MLPEKNQIVYDIAMDILNGTEVSISNEPGFSERIIEVPKAAHWLRKFAEQESCHIMDIGYTMSSLDWLGLLLKLNERDNCSINAKDIVKPKRVKSRYPKEWLDAIFEVPVEIGDIRKMDMKKNHFDVVTCISTIEHIGFDEAEEEDDTTAFKRSDDKSDPPANRSADVDENVIAQFRTALKPGGHVIITVPMGKGGSVLTRDSLGLYGRFWEYEEKSWTNLISQPGFEILEETFYGLDNDGVWYQVKNPNDLTEKSSELKPHAHGCAFVVLRKV